MYGKRRLYMRKEYALIDILKLLKKHIPLFLVAMLMLVVQAWSDLSLPEYMSQIVDVGIQKMGYVDGIPSGVADADLLASSLSYIGKVGGMMILIAFVGMIANVFSSMLGAIISSKMAKDLRSEVYTKVMAFSGAELEKFSIPSLITRTTNDITQVQTFYQLFFRMMLYAPIVSVGAISKVLSSNRSMSWIVLLGVSAVLLLIGVSFALVIPKFKIAQTLVDNVNRVLRENLTGLQVVRAFNNQSYEEERFEEVNQELTKNNRYINTAMSLMMPMMMLIMNLITVLIVFVGAKYIRSGNLQVGEMMAYITYAMQIMMSFIMISMVSAMIPRAIVSMKRIQEVLDLPISIDDKKDSSEKVSSGVITFENVSFQFDDAEECAVQDVSFETRSGQTTAIIGSTGSGKSTLLNLLMRFFDVSDGEIMIDGVNIKDYSIKTLRDSIALVPQKALLFRGSIEENVLFSQEKLGEGNCYESGEKNGVENREINSPAYSEEQKISSKDNNHQDTIIDNEFDRMNSADADENKREHQTNDSSNHRLDLALEVSQAKEFVDSLDGGVQSEVSQGGGNFSGGQKQRLSIARALAKDAPILVFDDSFSALDYKTDERLRKQIKKHYSDRNIIVVAQRVTSIMEADQILVMDQGRIVGRGTHKELLKSCDIYREIAKSQLSEEELYDE